MKRRNILHTGMAAMLLLSVSACEDFKFGNDFLDKPITTAVSYTHLTLPTKLEV